jgi:excisionase family DNA binding protein
MITEKMAFSPQEAAMATGLCLNTIYKLLKQRRLQAVKIDRKLLIPKVLTCVMEIRSQMRKYYQLGFRYQNSSMNYTWQS